MLKNQELVGLGMCITIILITAVLLISNVIRFSDISAAIAVTLVSGIVGSGIWGFRQRIINKTHSGATTKSKKNQDKSSSDEIYRMRNTVKINIDDFKSYEYDLKRNEMITGKINSDGLFNVHFLTKSSFKSFRNGSNFYSIDGIEDANYFEPKFEVNRRDMYYLVIENADEKRIIVDVDLDIKELGK